MSTHVDVVARRRRSPAVLRAARRMTTTRRSASALLAGSLLAVAAGLTWAMHTWVPIVPYTAYAPLLVIAGLFLPLRWLTATYVAVAAAFVYSAVSLGAVKQGWLGSGLIMLIIAVLMLWLGAARARLGVQGTLGESMLVDLRDRLRAHGELPALPEPWHAETALQSAYGESFSGDFVVANRSIDGDRLEVAVVDVSGKGVSAGTRALLLSGAFGGLLGAMEPDKFLPAANAYLLRQNWSEGFATAIHLALDLTTGSFCLGGAGHPPGVKFSAGSGLWEVLDNRGGPLLGVMQGVDFPRAVGRLERGDALLLYTDGVIETRTRDLTVGIDRMLGAAERLVSQGFSGGAARICAVPLAGETDDRAVVLIWRR